MSIAAQVARASQLVIDQANTAAKTLMTPVYNVVGYGADATGVKDSTAAFEEALLYGGQVVAPPGAYLISRTLTLPLGASLIGAGLDLTRIRFTGTGPAIVVGSKTVTGFPATVTGRVAELAITGLGSGVAGTVGILIAKALHATVDQVLVTDVECGFLLDGMELWCASCTLNDPRTMRVKYGLRFIAEVGKQVNHINVFGGYFYGQSPRLAGSRGVFVELGDTNVFHGTAVEDFDIGFYITSQNIVGQRFYGTRSESCTQGFVINTGSSRNIVVGHSEDIIFGGGEGSSGLNTILTDSGTFPVVSALPAVGVWNRGRIVRIEGGTGVADNIYVARKKADGSYEWAPLAP